MSILAVEILPDGIVFGADRNVTIRDTRAIGSSIIEIHSAQVQRPKVLKWPNGKALVGYVGAGRIGGQSTDVWLYEFIGRNLNFNSFENLANTLKADVQAGRKSEEGSDSAELLIIHLGGFELRDGKHVPAIWWIRNYDKLGTKEYEGITKNFAAAEEFWCNPWVNQHKTTPHNVKKVLGELSANFTPFWFHQGTELTVFNTLESFVKSALQLLYQHRPEMKPTTLADWENHVRMRILTMGAFFEAFSAPGKRLVGGGADCVSLPWPNDSAQSK